jgi:hypothetical protein
MTKKKQIAIKAIEELKEYCEGYFHPSWVNTLERLESMIKDYNEPL